MRVGHVLVPKVGVIGGDQAAFFFAHVHELDYALLKEGGEADWTMEGTRRDLQFVVLHEK